MSFRNMSSKVTPLSVILVSSGSKGYRLLFRYPFQAEIREELVKRDRPLNPFALHIPEEESADTSQLSKQSSIISGELDNVLANILAPSNLVMCDQRFEVTVDDVKFVGHPTLVQDVNAKWRDDTSSKREGPTINMFNVVFVLQASADWSLVHCYQDLSRRLALALKHEEKRCGYLSHQAVIMVRAEDEVAGLPEDSEESPFHLMLGRSKLCQDLRDVYKGLHKNGIARVYINNWIEVSFCLPHKVHNVSEVVTIKHDAMDKSLGAIRPYHAMLLLEDPNILKASLPKDCSPALLRIIHHATPLKRLQQLSQDADLALSQVFQLVGHLVYWGKATVIYPVCGNNKYILSPNAPTSKNTLLHRKFEEKFAGESLTQILHDFSLPTPLSEHRNQLVEKERSEAEFVMIVIWLLEKRLLVQLHTYVFLIADPVPKRKVVVPDEEKPKEVATPPLESFPVARGQATPQGSGSGQGSGQGENLSFDSDEFSISNSFDSFSTEEGRAHPRRRVLDMLSEHLTEEEKESVLAVPAASNPDDLKLFARLCPYLRGQHHLEEIMYYENVNRSQLHTLLDKFRDVLVTCSRQDAASVTYKEFL